MSQAQVSRDAQRSPSWGNQNAPLRVAANRCAETIPILCHPRTCVIHVESAKTESLWYGANVNDLPEASLFPPRLICLLLLALGLRLGWGLSRPSDSASIEQLPDQREYLELSDHLRLGSGLHFFDPRYKSDVYAYRTPGYPLFLAACGSSPRLARTAQALIDTSTVLAVYLLSRRWFATGQSLFAATLVALNPFLIYFSGLILSEALFTAMLTWGMLLLAGSRNQADNRGLKPYPVLGGLLLALAILVRPSGIGLPVLLGVTAAVLNRDGRKAYLRGWCLRPAFLMLSLTFLALAPWAYRNHTVLGRWIWTTTNGGMTAYDGFNDQATGASDQRAIARLPGVAQASELERDQFFTAQASRWIQAHPRRSLELAVAKILRTWSPVPLSAEYGRPMYRWVGGLYALPLDLLVILGVCFGFRSPPPLVLQGGRVRVRGSFLVRMFKLVVQCRSHEMPPHPNPPPRSTGGEGTGNANGLSRNAKAYLLIPAIYITAIHAMSVGSLRYRLPAEPAMAVIAAAGMMYVVRWMKRGCRATATPSL